MTLVGTGEAAKIIGMSRRAVYDWVARKRIPHYVVGTLYKFDPEELERWLASRHVGARR